MKNVRKRVISVFSLMLIGSAIALQINASCGQVANGKSGTCTWGEEGHYCETEVVVFENCSA